MCGVQQARLTASCARAQQHNVLRLGHCGADGQFVQGAYASSGAPAPASHAYPMQAATRKRGAVRGVI
eukprot:scaffold3006_cov111-Isochrysis_galbana.AAC.1